MYAHGSSAVHCAGPGNVGRCSHSRGCMHAAEPTHSTKLVTHLHIVIIHYVNPHAGIGGQAILDHWDLLQQPTARRARSENAVSQRKPCCLAAWASRSHSCVPTCHPTAALMAAKGTGAPHL